MKNNEIELVGKIIEEFTYSHSVGVENFYTTSLCVKRTSGAEDYIKLVCSDKVIDVDSDLTDEYVYIMGSIRTRNNEKHLEITVFVDELNRLDIEDAVGENYAFIDGYICKKAPIRTTPLGRSIVDLTIAVNRTYGKSDYIPCICWGKTARYVNGLDVGSNIHIYGRLQSRNYIKNNETKTAYELSVQNVEKINK